MKVLQEGERKGKKGKEDNHIDTNSIPFPMPNGTDDTPENRKRWKSLLEICSPKTSIEVSRCWKCLSNPGNGRYFNVEHALQKYFDGGGLIDDDGDDDDMPKLIPADDEPVDLD